MEGLVASRVMYCCFVKGWAVSTQIPVGDLNGRTGECRC